MGQIIRFMSPSKPLQAPQLPKKSKKRLQGSHGKYPANNLKALRESRGLSQKTLGRLAGIDDSHISKIEKGKRALSTYHMARLKGPLGVIEKDFVGVVEEQSIDAMIAALPERDQAQIREAIIKLISLTQR
jgi:transcriptional regulator with XRE-family HTH domain